VLFVLGCVKQIMPSKATDNADLLAAILSLCGDVRVALAHSVDAASSLQTCRDQLGRWPPQTADIFDFIPDESAASGVLL